MKHFKMIFRFLLSALVHPNFRNVLSLLLMEIQSSQSFKEKKIQKQYHILREFIFFFFFKFIFEKNKAKSIISTLWNTTHELRAMWILFQSVEAVDDLETNYPEKLPNTDVRLGYGITNHERCPVSTVTSAISVSDCPETTDTILALHAEIWNKLLSRL